MYIILKKNKKKTVTYFLWDLFLMGLNSTLSSYSQSKSEKKGGGHLGLRGNRLVLADLDL